jgi:hypothetical protein
MGSVLQEWDARLDATPKGQRAQLLDMLVGHPSLDTRARATPGPDGRSPRGRRSQVIVR